MAWTTGQSEPSARLPMVHILEEFKLQMLQQRFHSAERNVRLVAQLGCVSGHFWPLTPLGCVWGRARPVGSSSPRKRGGAESWAVLVVPRQFKPWEGISNWPLGSTSAQGMRRGSGICWEQCQQLRWKGAGYQPPAWSAPHRPHGHPN